MTNAGRINSVDVIRGVSLLGILLMNILGFGLPAGAGDDPNIAGGATGVNLWTWFAVGVLFEGKMRAIFSMLFGAGLILMSAHAQQRGDTARFADIWLRRSLWLLVFGMLHAYLLWDGDVLYFYGAAGLLLYPFRNLAPRVLLLIGLLMLASQTPKVLAEDMDTRVQKAEYDIALAVGNTKLPVTEELKKAKQRWEERVKEHRPGNDELQKTINRMRSGYLTILQHRAGEVPGQQIIGYDRFIIWDVMGMMFLGMALLKLGVLSAECSTRVYVTMMLAGFGVGIPVRWAANWQQLKSNFDILSSASSYLTYDLSRITIAAGYIGLVMLICRLGWLVWLTRRLAAVGQMALTNYLLHSVICTTIFYGYGLGLFGRLQRHQLYYVVGAIWTVQLIVSPVWLRHFQYGPMEWLWRSLTHWQRQSMRMEPVQEAVYNPVRMESP